VEKLWDSIDALSRLITWANWGIAASLLFGFTFTVITIKAGGRRDELVAIDDSKKAAQIADTLKLAGEASERAGKLEQGNLQLQGQVATLEVTAANAKKDAELLHKTALDSKAAQQKVEIDLAKQQERAANAEKELVALQQRIKPRHVTDEQARLLVELFKANPFGEISIACINGNKESCDLAAQLAASLTAGGWKVSGPSDVVLFGASGGPPVGIFIKIRNKDKVPTRANVLAGALERIGLAVHGELNPGMPEDAVELFIGVKP
jgi:hypothetical protein